MSSSAESIAVTNKESPTAMATPPVAECDMCSKIIQVLSGPIYPGTEDKPIQVVKLGNVGELLAVNCPHANWLRDIEYLNGPIPRYETHNLLFHRWAKDQQGSVGVCFNTSGFNVWNMTLNFELVYRPEIPEHPGTVRLLDGSWVDMDLVKEWPSRCNKLHGDMCDQTIGNVPPYSPRLLIDVIQGCVTECQETRPRFITLSYTWGESKNLRITKSNLEEMQKPGVLRSKNITMQLPATILDAIELTRVLGVRWLWVDSLCIPQDDDEILKRELAAMHRIYATSFLTIVAADGEDAEYGLRGLRGISKPRAIKQMIERLSQGEKVVFWPWNKSNNQVEYGLRYRHRMWTSQEYHFSKRRLVFENGQASWQCNHTEWTEDHVYNPEHEKLQKKPPESYIGHDAYLKLPSLNRLSALVEIFNTKTLRYGEDVYNAFSGYNTHLNSIFPHGLVYGLPQLFFDIALCWKPSGLVQRRTVSARYTGDPLRTGLPSWSWMGWKGQTNFPGDVEGEIDVFNEMGFTEAITDWYAMEFPGSCQRQPIHSRWSQCRNAPPGSLAELWRCEEFKPPAMYDTRSDSNLDDADSMPKELPGHIYHAHLGDNPIPATRWSLPASRWYPIPLNSDESDTSQAELHNEFQYLWCQTFRAYFTVTQDIVVQSMDEKFHLLKDQSGIIVGALRLHDEDDAKLFQQETQVELIAIAKGWTIVLSCYGAYQSESETQTEPEVEDEETAKHSSDNKKERSEDIDDVLQMEESEIPANQKGEVIPWMQEWEEAKKHKQDCYHVLWIEWKDGVAYRKCSGFVLEEEWDKVAEVSRVDITLG